MSQLIGAQNIKVEHNLPPSLLKGGNRFWLPPLEEGSEKKI